jgi:CRISPR-associated protein Cmr5
MSKRKIEAYIPRAIEAIEQLAIANNGEVAKQFNGYIASFGASVRQAGLLATVLFYGNANSNTEKEREKVVKAIEMMIGHDIVNHNQVEKSTRVKVEDAAIALKLAIRTYKLV